MVVTNLTWEEKMPIDGSIQRVDLEFKFHPISRVISFLISILLLYSLLCMLMLKYDHDYPYEFLSFGWGFLESILGSIWASDFWNKFEETWIYIILCIAAGLFGLGGIADSLTDSFPCEHCKRNITIGIADGSGKCGNCGLVHVIKREM